MASITNLHNFQDIGPNIFLIGIGEFVSNSVARPTISLAFITPAITCKWDYNTIPIDFACQFEAYIWDEFRIAVTDQFPYFIF